MSQGSIWDQTLVQTWLMEWKQLITASQTMLCALAWATEGWKQKTQTNKKNKKHLTWFLIKTASCVAAQYIWHVYCCSLTWKNVVFRHNPLLSPTWKHKLSLSTRCRGGVICSKYTGKLNLCITFGINKDSFMNSSALIGTLLWRFPDLIDSFLWSKFWCAQFTYKSKTLHQKYIVAFFLFLLL